ncbi:SRPBCC domain-containing protein [Haloarcula nitratireducens]|uniref:SRPBCC domain-containing protein n=1 Tax=Haloarcula nitratireducens TaxID=2487749 RepID=A0AAW4P8Q4_9EURY|nr:SRPBCC domain-containing protein [Halomicroarcula nitratireducens]MBX0294299.1 SRPBCC domain-containing protein [Halomicroarcula nitratireducens]
MTEVATAIDVPATPATVWDVLTDVSAYPRWNTLLSVRGEFAVGETVDARLSVPGLPTVSFSPEVTVVDPQRELSWQSTLFGVDAEHRFLLEPTTGGDCRFVQRETVDGPLAARLVDRFDRRLVRGFEQMNVGLRRRATELQ